MVHLEEQALRRMLGGESGQDAEVAAEHLLSCHRCSALATTVLDELRTEKPELREEEPLELVFGLLDRRRQWGLEALIAQAEWAELRRLNPRSQRDRVRMTKACHTPAFFRLLLEELDSAESWQEAEFLAGLALLAAEAREQRRLIDRAAKSDLQAEVWTAVANARRKAAEWPRANQALANAERHRREGSGKQLLEARILSITASVLADQGQEFQSLAVLDRCRLIYEERAEWALLARTLVQIANVLVSIEATRALAALDQASPHIPSEHSQLTILAELLRVRCLIGLHRPSEALQVYHRCSKLLVTNQEIRLKIRGRFTGALLLHAFGHAGRAERLLNEVVDRDIEHGLFKDAFLDLLYLYEHHMKEGNHIKAAQTCQRALTESALAEFAHDQLRGLWQQLLAAAQSQAIPRDWLRESWTYISAHWKNPAPQPPSLTFR